MPCGKKGSMCLLKQTSSIEFDHIFQHSRGLRKTQKASSPINQVWVIIQIFLRVILDLDFFDFTFRRDEIISFVFNKVNTSLVMNKKTSQIAKHSFQSYPNS